MVIDLYKENIPYNNGNNEKPEVVSYLTPTWYKLPAVIILPGGGYSIHAMPEAEPMALRKILCKKESKQIRK